MGRNYKRIASQRWKNVEWIEGSGRYALLAHCRTLTISLYQTLVEAEKQKLSIDQTGCGGGCVGHHQIIDLDSSPKS